MAICSQIGSALDFETCIEAWHDEDEGIHIPGDQGIVPLLKSQDAFVQELQTDECLTDAYLAESPNSGQDVATSAWAPTMLEVQLSEDQVPGTVVEFPGPCSIIEVTVPEDSKPGDFLTYYNGPLPEFRIEVPMHHVRGRKLSFVKDDGRHVEVGVPSGLGPGCVFEVEPPAAMVHAPANCKSGTSVRFKHHGQEWRARIPERSRRGYFPARLNPSGRLPDANGVVAAVPDSDSDLIGAEGPNMFSI